MAEIDTFHPVPLTIDPATKAVASTDPSLAEELEELNKYHRMFLSLETPNQVPGPPNPVQPKRSIQIAKMKDSGNASYAKGQYGDAIKMYDLALRMAGDRPPWEASGLVREELSTLYLNRSQAHMALQEWPEGANDAKVSCEMKKIGIVKGWWRRGQCLKEMGRLDEAEEWLKVGIEFEAAGPEKSKVGELEALYREVRGMQGKE